ncbi:MAG: cell division protein ZapA [Paludibacteraceae bacterium]|nr:cell division protein ZapA [Paludibacteraceae bacterium]
MADKQHINLQIGTHRISLNIPPAHEPFYRDAAVRLNERFKLYQSASPNKTMEELWIYVALDMAVNLQSDVRDKNIEPILQKVRELNDLITQTLNNT